MKHKIPQSCVLSVGFWFGVLVVFVFFARAHATDFTSSSFILRDPLAPGSSGFSNSTDFKYWGSGGQNANGRSTSASHELRAGFLYFPVTPPPPPPPPPPSPPPPPTGGGGVFGGNSNYFPGGSATSSPNMIGPCPGRSRSDLNCDGKVDLQDLSILLTHPGVVTGRILSFLFSDWTTQLPIPFSSPFIEKNVAEGNQSNQNPPLAQVSGSFEATNTPSHASFWGSVIGFGIKIVREALNLVKTGFIKLFNLFGI